MDQRRETAAIALALRALTRELRSASDWPRTPTAFAASSPQFFIRSSPCARIRSARDWPDALLCASLGGVARGRPWLTRGPFPPTPELPAPPAMPPRTAATQPCATRDTRVTGTLDDTSYPWLDVSGRLVSRPHLG